eukprot:gnl/TRDRNA2_/TRDRNA2_185561_c0_seq1.p1 gnl/TRDRNA2_/TRDRNA2_185561_c0~~gnl/TRDRNA2_/TRDRNA2_185561_c0_seq1.p1  ORF type:complete len:370 (-),score=67.57 gnl/TRDRNA2_/TRDRNA2_185561_c0_seq1:108-1217(-)
MTPPMQPPIGCWPIEETERLGGPEAPPLCDNDMGGAEDMEAAISAVCTRTASSVAHGLRMLGLPGAPLHYEPGRIFRLCGYDIREAVNELVEQWMDGEVEAFAESLQKLRGQFGEAAAEPSVPPVDPEPTNAPKPVEGLHSTWQDPPMAFNKELPPVRLRLQPLPLSHKKLAKVSVSCSKSARGRSGAGRPGARWRHEKSPYGTVCANELLLGSDSFSFVGADLRQAFKGGAAKEVTSTTKQMQALPAKPTAEPPVAEQLPPLRMRPVRPEESGSCWQGGGGGNLTPRQPPTERKVLTHRYVLPNYKSSGSPYRQRRAQPVTETAAGTGRALQRLPLGASGSWSARWRYGSALGGQDPLVQQQQPRTAR